jgi:hypothetical protein
MNARIPQFAGQMRPFDPAYDCAMVRVIVAVLMLAAIVPRGELAPVAKVGPFAFWTRPFELRLIPVSEWPYNRMTEVQLDRDRDREGVRMFLAADGSLYDHPAAQAQFVVNSLANFRLSGDPRDLEGAIANGERLLLHAEERDGAIFFPYPFDFELHGRGTLRALWYSGMAQGIALSGFVRLWEVTAEPRWLEAADRTFNSFLVDRQSGRPWFTVVDGGLLWFEEYPWSPLDHTLNGHIFAAYGLWDYWRVTRRADAALLLRGALTTALEVADAVRVPGDVSRYCIGLYCQLAGSVNPRYHRVHIGQYETLSRLTGEPRFAQLAELLRIDQRSFAEP